MCKFHGWKVLIHMCWYISVAKSLSCMGEWWELGMPCVVSVFVGVCKGREPKALRLLLLM